MKSTCNIPSIDSLFALHHPKENPAEEQVKASSEETPKDRQTDSQQS